MRHVVVGSMLALALLCGPAVHGDEDAIVVDLEWASSKLEAYHDGAAREGVRTPFGPDATLLAEVLVRDGRARYFIDRDFDGDFEDEKPVDFVYRSLSFSGFPRRKDVSYSRHATETVHPPWAKAVGLEEGVRVHLHREDRGDEDDVLSVTALLHREGHVVLEGRDRRVALYDGNGDLRYDHPEEDYLFLDVDGDGSALRSERTHERIRPGEPFRVRESGYVATLHGALGHTLRIEPSDAVPAPRSGWTPEEVPPSGVPQEGEARPFAEVKRAYVDAKAEVKRNRFPRFRLYALVLEMGRTGQREAFSYLQRIYRDKSAEHVRAAAIEAMGDVRYVEGADRLAKIAEKERKKDRSLFQAAVEALHRMGAPDRLKTLRRLARSAKDDKVYETAVLHIGYLGTPEAQKTLLELYRRCRRSPDRAAATYHAVTRFGSIPPGLDFVAGALESGQIPLQALALEDARHVGHPTARDLALAHLEIARKHVEVRRPIVEILGAVGDAPSVEALLDLAASLTPDERDRTVHLLQPVREPDAVALIRDALADKRAEVRALAAAIVVALPGPGLGALIVERLQEEEDPQARLVLVRAAGAHRATAAVPFLLAALRSEGADEALQEAALDALLSIGIDHEAVSGSLLELARSAPWEVRMRLMDEVLESRSLQAVPVLLAGLSGEPWRVRLAAAQGLAVLRVKEAVAPLIERLAAEEKLRVRRTVAETLFRVTGQNFYDVVEVWRRWWSEEGATFEVPAEVPERPESDRKGAYGEFYGVPVDTLCVIFVIDSSGSMGGGEWKRGAATNAKSTDYVRAIEQTYGVLTRLPDGAFVNVVLFASDVESWKADLVELNRKTRKELYEFLEQPGPIGGTNLYDGLELALKTKDVETVYLLSDGMPSDGRYVEDEEILAAVAELIRKNRAVIHTVALGWDSDLLEKLARQSDGMYVRR